MIRLFAIALAVIFSLTLFEVPVASANTAAKIQRKIDSTTKKLNKKVTAYMQANPLTVKRKNLKEDVMELKEDLLKLYSDLAALSGGTSP